jgi:hypothetical protein
MGRPKTDFHQITRVAAIRVALPVAAIIGFTCFVLQSTVWNQPKAPDREPYYTTFPGIDLSGVPPAKLPGLIHLLNSQRCPCECMRTLASCRNHHGSCGLSLTAARKAVEAARKP